MNNKGLIQVYTGNGKGKTTAAIGLAIRAAGAGKKVFIGQFVKGMHYSELDLIEKIDNIEIMQYGRDCFIYKDPTQKDIEIANKGLEEVSVKMACGKYDIVILDEACIALYYNLFSFSDLKEAVEKRAKHVEVIITGRYATDELIEIADLVTEMREIKHYYNNGVEARTGIEK